MRPRSEWRYPGGLWDRASAGPPQLRRPTILGNPPPAWATAVTPPTPATAPPPAPGLTSTPRLSISRCLLSPPHLAHTRSALIQAGGWLGDPAEPALWAGAAAHPGLAGWALGARQGRGARDLARDDRPRGSLPPLIRPPARSENERKSRVPITTNIKHRCDCKSHACPAEIGCVCLSPARPAFAQRHSRSSDFLPGETSSQTSVPQTSSG